MSSPAHSGFRFGHFEVRIRGGFLLRDGKRVRLEDLPFRMLLVLLESPGVVVSRDELRDRLWGKETFGELDNRLHVAAAKLREALGDSTENPRFIETVRRRGYQFIGEVTPIMEAVAEAPAGLAPPQPEPSAANIPNGQAAAADAPNQAAVPVPVQASEIRSPHRRKPRFGIAAQAVLSVVIVALGALITRYVRQPQTRGQTSPVSHDKIVVGGFTNATGDDAYNGLTHALRIKLEESPYLSLIADRRLRQIVKDPEKASLDEELRACASLNAQTLVRGRIAGDGDGYQVLLNGWQCAGGHLLIQQTVRAGSKNDVLSALDNAARRMRQALGESQDSLDKFNVPLTQATTASLAALQAFNIGEEKRAQGQEFDSISSYKLAADLDPQFALAYARLGTINSNIGELASSRQFFEKAFELRERTTDRERLYITAHYYSVATGEIDRSIQAYELWRSLYPRDPSPAINLGVEYFSIGEAEKSAELARIATQLEPDSNFPYAVLARAYLGTRQFGPLNALCNDPIHNSTDNVTFHQACYLAGFVQNDAAAMERQLQWSRGNPAESQLLDEAAWVAMYRGKISAARQLFAQGRQIALDKHFKELAAVLDLDQAGLEADLGYPRQARELALDALRLAPGSADTQAAAALTLARAGDTTRAEQEAAKAAAQSPHDTILNFAVLASMRAAIQLRQNNPEEALHALEPARPYDLTSAMGLAPAYYRGLTYLASKRPREAAQEFQRVVDHRFLAPNSPYIALALLNLGRSRQLVGKTEQAAAAFREVKAIWADADAGFPPRKDLDAGQR